MTEMNWSQPPVRDFGDQARDEELADVQQSASTGEAPTIPQAPAQPVRVFLPQSTSCAKCDGEVGVDGYCLNCGEKAPDPRLHFELTPSDWAAGVCDRGRRHTGNEDALAMHASEFSQGQAILVVCDGVSQASDSSQASLSAANAAVNLLAGSNFDWDLSLQGAQENTGELLSQLTAVANKAVLAASDPDDPNPASCTIAIGLLAGRQMLSATVGDSRVYWIPDSGQGLQLSTDDSMAQQQIDAGMDRVEAENGEYGHVITRWLGRDAPDVRPRVAVATAETDGWFLVCSDGLWNYASDPGQMGLLVTTLARELGSPTPLELAQGLVNWANEQGGMDNITVALARVHLPDDVAAAAEIPAKAESDTELDSATVRISR